MSTEPAKRAAGAATRKSDGLLWLAAAAVCATGGTWLYVTKPWATSPPPTLASAPVPALSAAEAANRALAAKEAHAASASSASDANAPDTVSGAAARVETSVGVEDPLRMADLAFAAGMLVEPEEYSAWTLYARLADGDSAHAAAARAGLEKVAAELLRRGTTALEQGRVDDAAETAQRILGVLPEHGGAAALAAEIAALEEARVAAERERELERARERERAERRAAAASARPAGEPEEEVELDPFAEAAAGFTAAMAGNRLLTPPGTSARDQLAKLVALAPEHETTRAARERFSAELVSRARESLEALDNEAAAVWLAEAERAGATGPALVAVQDELDARLVAAEAAKPMPASELNIRNYVPPDFPARAFDRGIEGWVELEFTVAVDSRTREITIVDSSHDSYFREEAVIAVSQWRFEPRQYKGQPIAQRARTRIRFVP